jgi:hypothetical protein
MIQKVDYALLGTLAVRDGMLQMAPELAGDKEKEIISREDYLKLKSHVQEIVRQQFNLADTANVRAPVVRSKFRTIAENSMRNLGLQIPEDAIIDNKINNTGNSNLTDNLLASSITPKRLVFLVAWEWVLISRARGDPCRLAWTITLTIAHSSSTSHLSAISYSASLRFFPVSFSINARLISCFKGPVVPSAASLKAAMSLDPAVSATDKRIVKLSRDKRISFFLFLTAPFSHIPGTI